MSTPTRKRLVTCRHCGQTGHETPDDPAPGVCPDCLDQQMAAATAWLDRRETEVSPEQLVAEARAYLKEQVGLTPKCARDFLRRVLTASEDP